MARFPSPRGRRRPHPTGRRLVDIAARRRQGPRRRARCTSARAGSWSVRRKQSRWLAPRDSHANRWRRNGRWRRSPRSRLDQSCGMVSRLQPDLVASRPRPSRRPRNAAAVRRRDRACDSRDRRGRRAVRLDPMRLNFTERRRHAYTTPRATGSQSGGGPGRRMVLRDRPAAAAIAPHRALVHGPAEGAQNLLRRVAERRRRKTGSDRSYITSRLRCSSTSRIWTAHPLPWGARGNAPRRYQRQHCRPRSSRVVSRTGTEVGQFEFDGAALATDGSRACGLLHDSDNVVTWSPRAMPITALSTPEP